MSICSPVLTAGWVQAINRGSVSGWANQPLWLGLQESLGASAALRCPLHLIPFCPHPGSQPGHCAQWYLRARVKLLEFVPALQALYALCDLGQVAVGAKPWLSYPQNGNRGRNLLLQSQCRLGEMVLLASLCTRRRGHVHHPDTLPPFVPCSSFQLPVCQYILKLLVLCHM